MLRNATLASIVVVGGLACSDDGTELVVDMGTVGRLDSGYDAGALDVGAPRDLGVEDSGSRDIGFSEPSIIGQGRVVLGNVALYVTARGTLTSTMPPVVILPTGPIVGHEYLFGPTEFLLGPGGVSAPDRLLVYADLRATGQSAFAGSGSETVVDVESHIRDLENVVGYVDELLGTTGPVDFLGHGYGAAIAMLYAGRHPERVGRLVLANPYPSNIDEYARWNETFRALLLSDELRRLDDVLRRQSCFSDFLACSLEIWRIMGPTWLCPENRAVFDSMRFESADFRAFEGFIGEDLRLQQYDWSADMGRVTAPSTIISGPCDPIPASAAQTYTASISASTHYVVPESGHFTITEQPETFRRIVGRALLR